MRLYDRLFKTEIPDEVPEGEDFRSNLNPDSLEMLNAFVEPGLKAFNPGDKFQFQRLGYFCLDKDSTPENLLINRTVPLRDGWAKRQDRK